MTITENENSFKLGTKKKELLRQGMDYLRRSYSDFNPETGERAMSEVYKLIGKYAQADPKSIDTRLIAELGLDSLEFVEMQMELEDNLDIIVQDSEWVDIRNDITMRAISNIAYQKLKN
ncbi:MAG: acyl carrier protein [Nanoarchaeota archaeon]|nr:acyl carrier protein [Nanoarchaeota archaeon]